MLAAQIHEYGAPDVFRLEEVQKTVPRARDLLVRVVATSVNPVDCKARSGAQRNVMRYRLPWILGLDVSGIVEAVGAKVTAFRPGDAIVSSPVHSRPGTYAEYVCIDERQCAHKPKNVTHEEAASFPLVGLTAYQCVVEHGRLRSGERVLIHAGSGGVGSFAIQLAKHLGARVITTCSEKNADFVRELGADEVIDYRNERFADVCEPVDLVLDTLGPEIFADNLRVLKRGGRLMNITVDVGGHLERYGRELSVLTLGLSLARIVSFAKVKKNVEARHVIKRCDGMQLQAITHLVERGRIRPTIDRVLPLSEIAEAHRYSESNRARGKIVLSVAPR